MLFRSSFLATFALFAPLVTAGVDPVDCEFDSLLALVDCAGIGDALDRVTVFGPCDFAFARFLDETGFTVNDLCTTYVDELIKILTYHVVDDEILAADIVASDENLFTLKTLQGGEIKINRDKLTVNGNNIVDADAQFSPFVLHGIDGVLIPPTYRQDEKHGKDYGKGKGQGKGYSYGKGGKGNDGKGKGKGYDYPSGKGGNYGKDYGKGKGKDYSYGKDYGKDKGKDYSYDKDYGKGKGKGKGYLYGKDYGKDKGKDYSYGKDYGKGKGKGKGYSYSKDYGKGKGKGYSYGKDYGKGKGYSYGKDYGKGKGKGKGYERYP